MLFGMLRASLLRNLLKGKGIKANTPDKRAIRAGQETIRAAEGAIRADQGY